MATACPGGPAGQQGGPHLLWARPGSGAAAAGRSCRKPMANAALDLACCAAPQTCRAARAPWPTCCWESTCTCCLASTCRWPSPAASTSRCAAPRCAACGSALRSCRVGAGRGSALPRGVPPGLPRTAPMHLLAARPAPLKPCRLPVPLPPAPVQLRLHDTALPFRKITGLMAAVLPNHDDATFARVEVPPAEGCAAWDPAARDYGGTWCQPGRGGGEGPRRGLRGESRQRTWRDGLAGWGGATAATPPAHATPLRIPPDRCTCGAAGAGAAVWGHAQWCHVAAAPRAPQPHPLPLPLSCRHAGLLQPRLPAGLLPVRRPAPVWVSGAEERSRQRAGSCGGVGLPPADEHAVYRQTVPPRSLRPHEQGGRGAHAREGGPGGPRAARRSSGRASTCCSRASRPASAAAAGGAGWHCRWRPRQRRRQGAAPAAAPAGPSGGQPQRAHWAAALSWVS